jgi:hypothetical protein
MTGKWWVSRFRKLVGLFGAIFIAVVLVSAGPAGASTNIANAALDSFFPTNGATFEAGQGYSNDLNAIQTVLINKCLESAGFQAEPYTPRPYSGDNTEFPNLPYLRTHGFIVQLGKSPDPTQGMTAAEASAYQHQADNCDYKASAKFASIMTLGSSLRGEWMRKVAEIDESKAFKTALRKFASCTAKSGIDVTSIDSFFTDLSSQMRSSGGSTAVNLHFASVYATCLAPAETMRDNLRTQARQAFFSTNAEQIDQLTGQVNSIVKVLGHEYRIKWQAN